MSFDCFDDLLNDALGKDPQHWSDDTVLEAEQYLRSFTSDEWLLLRSEWRSRSEAWQLLCADALSIDAGIAALLEMIIDGTDSVALTAARSLQPVLTGRKERLEVSKNIVERLKSLSVGSDRYLFEVFEKLVFVKGN